MHAYTGKDLCTQLGFQKPMKGNFFALMLRFVLGSKDLGSYIFRILMCIVGKP